MGESYDNLDEIELFEKKKTYPEPYQIQDTGLIKSLEEVDELFEPVENTALIYPIEETLHSLLTTGKTEYKILGLTGDFRQYASQLDESNFSDYRGDYIMPAVPRDVTIKINYQKTESLETNLELENIEVQIPIDNIIPDNFYQARF